MTSLLRNGDGPGAADEWEVTDELPGAGVGVGVDVGSVALASFLTASVAGIIGVASYNPMSGREM